jgi:hypothetical protein
VFAIGLLGSLGSGGGQQTKEQVIMEAYNFAIGGDLTVTFRNVGPASVNLADADYFVNGIPVTGGQPTCSNVTPGGSCGPATLTNDVGSLVAGAAYAFKIVTPTGGVFSYSVIYGGAS